jgi:two-component system, chemotaxis family, protein-glutamate methylesterase/glutaminase
MEETPLIPQKIIIVGGSAGSLDVLLKVLPNLDPIDRLAIVIVLHRRSADDNILEELLRMKSGLRIKEIQDKTVLKPGRIHVAPPDYHLLFEKDYILSLDVSDKVNYSRPSIDVAFESVADAFREKVVGILLSGANADGTHGLQTIRRNGGYAIIQSPDTADVPFMPTHALKVFTPDAVMTPPEMVTFVNAVGRE